jgi:5-methylcytosine-specific restriction endonuclease McrA
MKRLMDRTGGICEYCGVQTTTEAGPRRRTIDHVIPKCLEGSDDLDNLKLACDACNRAKADKLVSLPPLTFKLEIGNQK